MGCGWLGLPLAKYCISKGYNVKGTTTSFEKVPSLEKEGIKSSVIQLKENGIEGNISGFLENIDILILNVPPRLRTDKKANHVKKINHLEREIRLSQVKKIIFVSSTSVYGHISGVVTEKTVPEPVTESGRQLLATERIFNDSSGLKATIIRFGGLLGPQRHPVTILSGKTGLSNGNSPVNLIHLNDCIAIMMAVIKQGWWNETFNAVYPLHPTKREYYTEEAQKKGLLPPEYGDENSQKGKIIVPFNLVNVKKYRFKTSIVG